jgi:DNA-binding MarR family transcriptional regulator
MGQGLETRIARSHFDNPMLNAIIHINVAANFLQAKVDIACAPLGITGVQYNILRILKRSKDSNGVSRNDIVRQIIEKSVDVTRSIDGLVKLGFVARQNADFDRRVVLHTITPAGAEAIEKVDPYFKTMLDELSDTFTEEELRTIASLCEKLYSTDPKAGMPPSRRR